MQIPAMSLVVFSKETNTIFTFGDFSKCVTLIRWTPGSDNAFPQKCPFVISFFFIECTFIELLLCYNHSAITEN